MTKRIYLISRLTVAFLVAAIVSVSVTQGNYIIPIVVSIAGALALFAIKNQVSEVIADERDYYISGKAARWTVYITAVLFAIGSMILMAMRNNDPLYELAASFFAYSGCGLLIMYSILFRIFKHQSNG